MVSLKGMNVEALMNLRNQIDKRLLEYRAELEKELEELNGQAKRKAVRTGSSLRGRKVPPKYRSRSDETWARRGARFRWLVAYLRKGMKLDDFLIERRRAS